MSQLVYNVGIEETQLLVKSISPYETTSDEAQALEYEQIGDAMATATYLNGARQGDGPYVVVGPRPHPHK